MQLTLFVELCSEMSSRMIFWPNKSICTLIWIPSKYTQMSVNPNHYLEPCLRKLIEPRMICFFNKKYNIFFMESLLELSEKLMEHWYEYNRDY